MRITQIQAIQPETPGAPQDWRTSLGQIVVQVHTDTGLTGVGVGGGGAASIHVIHTVLSDLLIGQDARDVEQLNREMLTHTMYYGRKGLVVMAISGVDLALWDLRGKQQQCPVSKLLDPAVDLSRSFPTYLTVFDESEAQQAVQAGHSAIKLHVGRFGKRPIAAEVRELVLRVREQLGDQAMVMVDAFASWDLESSLRVADALSDLDVSWIEEPLPPDDLNAYEQLVLRSPVPIAGGEHEYTIAGFQELIDRKLHHVLQPDVNWCGGLTTLVAVYESAQASGLRVCPHRGCEPFALPAIAALDDNPLAESPRSWFTCFAGAPQIRDVRIGLVDQPGFGVELT